MGINRSRKLIQASTNSKDMYVKGCNLEDISEVTPIKISTEFGRIVTYLEDVSSFARSHTSIKFIFQYNEHSAIKTSTVLLH